MVRIQALAVDYDGTIAHHGKVAAGTQTVLAALRPSGRRLVLVTGRRLEDLQVVAPDLAVFDAVVAENGAVLYDPSTGDLTPLAEPPPPALLDALHRRGVPFDSGRVIVGDRVCPAHGRLRRTQ